MVEMVGLAEGESLGACDVEGEADGCGVLKVGAADTVGDSLGLLEGKSVGEALGFDDGSSLGLLEGTLLGFSDGDLQDRFQERTLD